MSNEEKNFDDLLRSKLNEREFFFDELNWDKAEQAIVREERSKKTRRVILIFLGGFILGAAIMFPLASMLTSNNKQNSLAAPSAPVAINDSKNSTVPNNTATTPITSASNNAALIQGPATTTASEPNDKNTTPALADKASRGDKKAAKHKKAKTADNPDTYAYVRPASERKHKKAIENPYIDELPDNLKPKNSNATNPASNNSSQNQESVNNSNAKNNADKNTRVANNTSANNTKQQNTTNNSSSANNNSTANTVASTDGKNNSQTNNTNQAQTKLDSNKLQALAPVTNSAQNKNFVTQENQTADVPKPAFKPTNTISVDAGAGYSLGWKNETGKGGSGISPVIGLRLDHSFSKKISLGIGLRYYGLTNLNTTYSSTLVSYDFGYNSTITTVSPQMLHYLAIPAELQYHFGHSNIISLGGTLLYLVNSSSTVNTYTQNGLEAPSSQKKTLLGYTDGFNQFDGQMVIAYRRKLFGAFGASAEAYYGLLDVENNSFFFNSFERNSGLRLVLSYDIIK